MASPTTTVPARGLREPPALYRQPLRIWSAADFSGEQWRFLVGQAPIVRSCVTTIIMYLESVDWYLEGDDQDALAYYTNLLETADEGAGWNVYTARLIDDALVMPFGGVAEMGVAGEGVVWTAHLDSGTIRPTGLPDFPYGQIDPWGAREPVPFREEQIGRVRWMPKTNLKQYEWTQTPAADAIPAITALVRADRFWQSLLLDTPPAGILDLMDFTYDEASDWYESWKKLLSGVDAFKVPVLYGTERQHPATFVRYNSSPVEIDMMSVIKNYAEQVTACFGLTLGDLGMFNQEIRLAGAAKMIELTKRQGPANIARGLKSMIDNDILPDGVTFKWREIDTEDSLRAAQGRMQSATALATVVNAGLVPPRLAELAAQSLGIVPQEAIDQYNAEIEAGGVAPEPVEEAPEDATPTGDQRAMPPRSKWSKRMKVVAEKLLAPSRRGFTAARIKGLIETGVKAYGTERSMPEIVRQAGGCIVALVPPQAASNALAVEGGEKPAEMHITIAYLDAETDRDLLKKVIEGFAAISPTIDGEVSGVGRFVGPEGEDAVYASVDVPALPAWRARLVEMIEAAGITVNKEHGFSPHITLQYVPTDSEVVLPTFEPVPLAFAEVWLWDGDERTSWPLNPDAVALSRRFANSQARSRETAEAALLKKLSKESWWKSPKLVDDVFTILTGAYEDGIAGAIRSAGGKVKPATVNLTNKAVLGELEAHAGDFITQIDDGTRNMIVKHVMAGVERGLSSPDIADAIVSDVRGVLVDTWKGRVESIVGFEINQAETHAALREYQEIGLEKKRWHAIPGLACEICLSNDDLGEVDMDYQFETVFGGADGPPGHPNVCHCYVSFSKSELKKLGESPEFWLGD